METSFLRQVAQQIEVEIIREGLLVWALVSFGYILSRLLSSTQPYKSGCFWIMRVGGGRSGPFFGHLPLNKRPCNDFAVCKTILLSAVGQILSCLTVYGLLKLKGKKKEYCLFQTLQ